jgi:hypothetical protein
MICPAPGIGYEPPSNASRADGVTLIVALLNPWPIRMNFTALEQTDAHAAGVVCTLQVML